MTQPPPPGDQRRFGIFVLVLAAVFVALSLVVGTLVTPWWYLLALTAIPNVVTGLTALRPTATEDAE